MSGEAESVTYRVEDHVAVITLNRPEQRNALNFDAYDRLERAFRQTCAPVNAALLTALLFALFHAHLPSVLPLFVMSLGLSWIYQSSRSLLAAMVMHAAYNGFNVLWLLLAPPAG